MSGKFDKYIDESNKKLKDILVSGGVDETVKNSLLNAFSDELSNSIFKDSLKNIDLIFDETSLVCNDEYISQVLSQDKPGVAQINKAIDICEIQKNILKNSAANKARIKNENIDVCLKKLLSLKNEISLEDNLKASEKKIDDLIGRARKSSSLNDYDIVLDALNQHENTINSASQLKQNIPYTKYNDIKKIRKQIIDEKYNLACKLLVENDNTIVTLIKNNTLISYNEALEKCTIQNNYLDIFDKNQWKKPKITYLDIANCTAVIASKKETLQAYIELKNLDDSLEKMIRSAEETFDIDKCEQSKESLNDYEKKLSAFKAKKAEMPKLVNDDIRKTDDRINGIIAKIEDKNALHKKMNDVDSDISKAIQSFDDTPISCDKIADLLTGQKHLLDECSRKRFPLPTLKNKDIAGLVKKYSVFKDVLLTDTEISKMDNDLSSKSKYDNYINKCKKLDNLLSECRRSNYGIPNIDNANPAALVKQAESEWNKTLIKYKIKKWSILSGIGAALILALVLYIYFSSRTKFPYNMEAMRSMNYADIKTGLEECGYTNISCVPDNSGYEKGGTFTGIYIDDVKDIEQGKLYKKSSPILVQYASLDRVDLKTVLNNWKDYSFEKVLTNVQSAGCTNVSYLQDRKTLNASEKGKISNIKIDGVEYDNQAWYVPKNAQIAFEKYKLYCTPGLSSTDFLNKDVFEVKRLLEERGFDKQIEIEYIKSGMEEPGKVLEILIEDSSIFSSNTEFPHDAKIIEKATSMYKIDLTSILDDYSNREYTLLKDAVKNQGLTTDISLISYPTYDESLNNIVKEITINGETYNSGKCYVDRDASISITYFTLYRKIGLSSNELTEMGVYYLQSLLKEIGFEDKNIIIEEVDTGWIKSGTVLSIDINGTKYFNSYASFGADSKIVIQISSWGRVDLKTILDRIGWRNVDSYTILEERLRANSFTEISTEHVEVKDQKDIRNNSVKEININSEDYNDDECYVKKDTPIVITYYVSLISPGDACSENHFKGLYKDPIIEYMISRGFVYDSSKDIVTGGIKSIGKDSNTIIDIYIDGRNDFKSSDYFVNGTKFYIEYWK